MDHYGVEFYTGMSEEYRRRRDRLMPALVQAGFKCTAPDGAYYILADFSGLSDMADTEFALWLAQERGVAPVPGSSFFSRPELGRKYVRFVFCKTDDLLQQAAARLTGGSSRGAVDVQR
jgi:aminotransferase